MNRLQNCAPEKFDAPVVVDECDRLSVQSREWKMHTAIGNHPNLPNPMVIIIHILMQIALLFDLHQKLTFTGVGN
jgi:hypothetical protein